MLPPDYPGLVNGQEPEAIAAALLQLAAGDNSEGLREIFLRRFSLEQHLAGMAAALRSLEAGHEIKP
jgi:hypothetical protein